MPELPEVEVIRQALDRTILGATILSLKIHRADIVRAGLSTTPWYSHTSIRRLSRRGKCLIVTCEGPKETRHLVSELGMTGLWYYDQDLAPSPQHLHAHLTLSGAKATHLYYWNSRRFGRIWLLNDQELQAFYHRRFGPEVLDLEEPSFTALIKNCRGRLKPFLLDQHRLAGIGNIYANEILFRAGLHPHAQGHRLYQTSLHRLFLATKATLQEAIAAGGSSIRDFRGPDGSRGRFQETHRVYQKTSQPCPNGCGGTIKRLRGDRSSFFCQVCQKKR